MPLIRQTPWTSQPQIQAGLNPIFPWVKAAYLANGLDLERADIGTSLTNTGSVKAATVRGRGSFFALNTYLLRENYSPVTTSDGAFTGDFTAMVFCTLPTTGVRTAFSQRLNSGALSQFGITGGLDASFGALNGAAQFGTYSTASTSVAVSGGADGAFHMYGIRRLGTAVTGWIDGIQRASTTGTVRAIGSASAGLGIGCAPAGAGSANTQQTTSVICTVAFNVALPDGLMQIAGANPWNLFTPLARRLWIPVSAGGASNAPRYFHRTQAGMS